MQFQHIPTSWPEPKITYPRLRRLINYPDVVVLFDTSSTGMCLASKSLSSYKVGSYHTGLIPSAFEDYRDILQLKNDAQ